MNFVEIPHIFNVLDVILDYRPNALKESFPKNPLMTPVGWVSTSLFDHLVLFFLFFFIISIISCSSYDINA